MPFIGLAIYVLLAAVVGWFGQQRAIGFLGFFVLALVFSPILIGLALAITIPKSTLGEGFGHD